MWQAMKEYVAFSSAVHPCYVTGTTHGVLIKGGVCPNFRGVLVEGFHYDVYRLSDAGFSPI